MSHSKAFEASKDRQWKMYERATPSLESAYPNYHFTLAKADLS